MTEEFGKKHPLDIRKAADNNGRHCTYRFQTLNGLMDVFHLRNVAIARST